MRIAASGWQFRKRETGGDIIAVPRRGEIDGPNIAGFRHKAIKPGDQSNDLLVVLRGKKMEIFVNGVSVMQPLTLDRELKSAMACLMAFTANQEGRRS